MSDLIKKLEQSIENLKEKNVNFSSLFKTQKVMQKHLLLTSMIWH